MKHLGILTLAALCAVGSISCAQLSRAPEPVASAKPPETATPANGQIAPRLDAKWLSAVVGMPVESSAGAKLGKVQEVIVDGYGQPRFAILSYGGRVAGFGARYVAVPWETVGEMLDRDKLVVNQPVLESAPALASADARNGDWRRDAERYWSAHLALASEVAP
jgi:sporulation protein YlmC with PRC-barrel domain